MRSRVGPSELGSTVPSSSPSVRGTPTGTGMVSVARPAARRRYASQAPRPRTTAPGRSCARARQPRDRQEGAVRGRPGFGEGLEAPSRVGRDPVEHHGHVCERGQAQVWHRARGHRERRDRDTAYADVEAHEVVLGDVERPVGPEDLRLERREARAELDPRRRVHEHRRIGDPAAVAGAKARGPQDDVRRGRTEHDRDPAIAGEFDQPPRVHDVRGVGPRVVVGVHVVAERVRDTAGASHVRPAAEPSGVEAARGAGRRGARPRHADATVEVGRGDPRRVAVREEVEGRTGPWSARRGVADGHDERIEDRVVGAGEGDVERRGEVGRDPETHPSRDAVRIVHLEFVGAVGSRVEGAAQREVGPAEPRRAVSDADDRDRRWIAVRGPPQEPDGHRGPGRSRQGDGGRRGPAAGIVGRAGGFEFLAPTPKRPAKPAKRTPIARTSPANTGRRHPIRAAEAGLRGTAMPGSYAGPIRGAGCPDRSVGWGAACPSVVSPRGRLSSPRLLVGVLEGLR